MSMKSKKIYGKDGLTRKVLAAFFASSLCCAPVFAAENDAADEATDNAVNDLGATVVTAERIPTERMDTPANVTVITAKEIAANHYATVGEAVEHVNGVTVTRMGGQQQELVRLNGDGRVLLLVDGERLNNEQGASTGRSSVDLNMIPSMKNIQRIEIVKGGASALYGSDAVGGVINIITKKGALEPHGKIDLATGAYSHHIYRFNYSGSTKDGSFRYFVSGMRDQGGSGKYYDQMTGREYNYHGTDFKESSFNIRLDKYFGKDKQLTFSYNHTDAYDGYPITVPDYRYMTKAEYLAMMHRYKVLKLYGAIKNQGYRNNWYSNGFRGTATGHNNFDYDLTYSFGKDHDMESYVRAYYQVHKYWLVWGPREENVWSPRPVPLRAPATQVVRERPPPRCRSSI